MALTDYEKELFKSELPKYYTVQVLNSSDIEIDLINANRMDYESAKFIENMANSEAGFNFGLSFSSVFSCTFHELETGLTVSDYKDSKIIVNLNLDYLDESDVEQTATILMGTFWIDSILLTNKKNKQYELVAYDYLNKINWQDVDLKPYHLGMPNADYIKASSLGRFGQDERDMATSFAYMSRDIAETIDCGNANSLGAWSSDVGFSESQWLSRNAAFVTALNNAGFYCGFRGDTTVITSTRTMFGNSVELYYMKVSNLEIYPSPTFGQSYSDFIQAKKHIEIYNINQKTSDITAQTSFNAAFPNFFAPRYQQDLFLKSTGFYNGSYVFPSNFATYSSQSFLNGLAKKKEDDATYYANDPIIVIPIHVNALSTTNPPTARNWLLTESFGVRIHNESLYDEFVGSILDDEDEYKLAIKSDGILNQKDFFDGMAKWFLYNISASKSGALQVKRLYDLDLAMSNYGRAENDPIIPSINYLYPKTGLYPNTGLYPQGEKELIKVNQIKDTSIGQYLKGVKKLIFKVPESDSVRSFSKSGIHLEDNGPMGTISLTFDSVTNDSQLTIDTTSFYENFGRWGDPEAVFDDKRGYILMSALQYLNRAFGQVEFSSIPYLQAGEFVTVNLDDESVNVLIVKNELNGISVAQSQTITGM